MHPQIKVQKELMELALKALAEIETIERFIGPIDPITTKVMVAELKNQYLDITSKLFAHFLIQSDVV